MKRSIAIGILMYSSAAVAHDTVDAAMVFDACIKDDRISFCRDLKVAKDNGERIANNTMKAWGLTNAAVITGMLYKASIEHKIDFVDRSNEWYLPGNERHIEFRQNEVFLRLIWPLRW